MNLKVNFDCTISYHLNKVIMAPLQKTHRVQNKTALSVMGKCISMYYLSLGIPKTW